MRIGEFVQCNQDDEYSHKYQSFKCPNCGAFHCVACRCVNITDESKATGSFRCWCGYKDSYPISILQTERQKI